ncbi:hypothetical protein LINPERPRIM_LOCUS32950 [Linum perenne]
MWKRESTSRTRNSQVPKFSLCCKEGQIKLPKAREPPEFLKSLLLGNNEVGRHFRDHIRMYNGIFCFSSMGGKVNHSLNEGRGVYVFSIAGQIYHHIGSLIPPAGSSPKFAQLYIHETEKEVDNRMHAISVEIDKNPLREFIISGLKEMLDDHNILVQTFRYAKHRLSEEDVPHFKIKLLAKRRADGREYDMPTGDEVAGLIITDSTETFYEQDIIVQRQSTQLERISLYHPSLMSLQYPLIFPYGEDGWRSDIELFGQSGDEVGDGKMISQCDFYRYKIQTRLDESHTLLLSGKLFQQYVVNAYALIEAERLNWIRNNQRKLRVNIYKGLMDQFMQGHTDTKLTGKHIILSSSYTGSPRYKFENFQDAMAICRWTGYPDLFLTFTCNAKWPEIQFMVDLIDSSGRKNSNRADIIARVFKLKLNQLLEEIIVKKIFGRTTAHVEVVEFQKRGLPHVHMLIFLTEEDKLYGPSDIDSIIQAEIPDSTVDPIGFEAVSKYMIHGPCGRLFPNASCTIEGICSKHFPKKFCSQTTIDDDGYPKYRRRDNKRFVHSNGCQLDNRFVVPYNRYLLLRFQAHINLEFCNKSRSIKYLFKYINKPPDRANATIIQENLDEIKAFLDCRYLGTAEACWRIFKFDIHHHNPSVLRMSYHLPGEQYLLYQETEDIEDVLSENDTKKTMLMAWMDKNIIDPGARKYTFLEFPQYYVWSKKYKNWGI